MILSTKGDVDAHQRIRRSQEHMIPIAPSRTPVTLPPDPRPKLLKAAVLFAAAGLLLCGAGAFLSTGWSGVLLCEGVISLALANTLTRIQIHP